MNARPLLVATLWSLSLLATSTIANAQDPDARPLLSALNPELQELVIIWLTRDCGAEEKRLLEDRLISVGATLEAVFWEAYRLGPTPDSLARDQQQIRKRYQIREKWLAAEGGQLFGKEEMARLRAIPEDEYLRRETETILVGYRTRAILGLGVIGTPQSLAQLKELSVDADNPAVVAARQAATEIEQRHK